MGNTEVASFHLNAVCCLNRKHKTCLNIYLLRWGHLSFAEHTTMHQTDQETELSICYARA